MLSSQRINQIDCLLLYLTSLHTSFPNAALVNDAIHQTCQLERLTIPCVVTLGNDYQPLILAFDLDSVSNDAAGVAGVLIVQSFHDVEYDCDDAGAMQVTHHQRRLELELLVVKIAVCNPPRHAASDYLLVLVS